MTDMLIDFDLADMPIDLKINNEVDDMLEDTQALAPTYPGQATGLMSALELRRLAGACPRFCNRYVKPGKRGCCRKCKKKLDLWLTRTRQNGLNLEGKTGVKVLVDALNVFRTVLRFDGNPAGQLDANQWCDLFTTVRDELKVIFPSENAEITWFFRPGWNGWFTEEVNAIAQPILANVSSRDQIMIPDNCYQQRDCDDIAMLSTAGLLGMENVVMVTNDMLTEYVYREVLRGETSKTINLVQTACVNGSFIGSAKDVLDFMLTDTPVQG